nr:MAG TPA_asm: hypothetical protein [Caudoviricetes sp.]
MWHNTLKLNQNVIFHSGNHKPRFGGVFLWE